MTKLPGKPAGVSIDRIRKGGLSSWLDSAQAATGVDPRTQRTRAGVTFLLLDISGSMGTGIVEAAAGARKFNAESLAAGLSVGLILFESRAWVAAVPSRNGIAEQLESLSCGGSTNMAAAVELATAGLKDYGGLRTIVIATDGCPDDRSATLNAAEKAKRDGIRILTIGTSGCDAGFLALLASSADFAVVTPTGALGKALASAAPLLLK